MAADGHAHRATRRWVLLLALSPALCASTAATRRLKTTVLSWNPRMVAYENFLSDEEVDMLRKEAENQTFLRTALIGRDGFFVKGSTITSRIANMPESHGGYVVRRRIADTTQLPVEFQEPTRVLRYNSSDFFRGHIDAHALSGRFSSTRTATFFVYLNDVAEGGETHFPLAVPIANVSAGRGFVREGPAGPHCAHLVSKESSQGGVEAEYIDGYDLLEGRGAKLRPPISRRGLSIVPRKGLAILWHSRRPDGQLDPSSQHVGCPVKKVDRHDPDRRFKYSLTTWIHFEPPRYELMEDAPLDTHGAFLSLGRPHGGARGTARLRPSQDRFDQALLGGWLGPRGFRQRALVQRQSPRGPRAGSAGSAPADGNTTATASQRLDSALARLAAEERNVSFSRARLERRGARLDGGPAAGGLGGGAGPGSIGRGAAHAPGREGTPRAAGRTPHAAEGPAEASKKAAALRGAGRAADPQRATEPAAQQRAARRDDQHETPELARELDRGEELRRVMWRDEAELERELRIVSAGPGPSTARQARDTAGAAARGGPTSTEAAGPPGPVAPRLDKARGIVGELARSDAGPNSTGAARRPGPASAAPDEARHEPLPQVVERSREGAVLPPQPLLPDHTQGPQAPQSAPDKEQRPEDDRLRHQQAHEARSVVREMARSAAGADRSGHNGTGAAQGPRPAGAAPAEAAVHDADGAARHNRTGEAMVAHRSRRKKHHHWAKKAEHHHNGHHEAGLNSTGAADHPKAEHHHKRHHDAGLHSSGAANHPKVPACVDVAPPGEEKWHDADGPQYDCFFYAQGDGCKLYGRRFHKFNLTAADACCACGGGRWTGEAAQETKIAKLQAENARLLKEIERLKSQVGLLDEVVRPQAETDGPDDWSESDLADWMPCPAWQNSTCAVHWETSPDSSVGLADDLASTG